MLNPGPHSVQTPRNSIILMWPLFTIPVIVFFKSEEGKTVPWRNLWYGRLQRLQGAQPSPTPLLSFWSPALSSLFPWTFEGGITEIFGLLLVSIEMFSKWAILNSPIFNHTYKYNYTIIHISFLQHLVHMMSLYLKRWLLPWQIGQVKT